MDPYLLGFPVVGVFLIDDFLTIVDTSGDIYVVTAILFNSSFSPSVIPLRSR